MVSHGIPFFFRVHIRSMASASRFQHCRHHRYDWFPRLERLPVVLTCTSMALAFNTWLTPLAFQGPLLHWTNMCGYEYHKTYSTPAHISTLQPFTRCAMAKKSWVKQHGQLSNSRPFWTTVEFPWFPSQLSPGFFASSSRTWLGWHSDLPWKIIYPLLPRNDSYDNQPNYVIYPELQMPDF